MVVLRLRQVKNIPASNQVLVLYPRHRSSLKMCCYIPSERAYVISARISGHIRHARQTTAWSPDGRSSSVFAGDTTVCAPSRPTSVGYAGSSWRATSDTRKTWAGPRSTMTRDNNDAGHPQSRQHARQRDILSNTSDRVGLNLGGRQWDNAITPGSQPERHVHTQTERSPRKRKSAR